MPQLAPHRVAVCISYTDDTGQTARVIKDFRRRHPFVTAVTDPQATDIDRKIVSAVALARSRYVWLFGDDDLPEPGAVDRVLGLLREDNWGLLVLNASSHDSELSSVVEERRVRVWTDRLYASGEHEALLRDTASYATFLGGLVFNKTMWDSVNPTQFLGTDYVHVAVLYRGIVGQRARLVAAPQLRMRLGSATWASRYFEVELLHWPRVIWCLPGTHYSDSSKSRICQRKPIASLARLLATRAYGYYGQEEYRRFIAPESEIPRWKKAVLRMPLLIPESWVAMAFTVFRRAQALCGSQKLALSLYRMRSGR